MDHDEIGAADVGNAKDLDLSPTVVDKAPPEMEHGEGHVDEYSGEFAAERAYKAGYRLPAVEWREGATDEQRTPGVHHCPFAPGDPLRDEWLRGLKAALEAPTQDPATIIREINDELGVADHVA